MRLVLFFMSFIVASSAFAQEPSSNYRTQKMAARDSIRVDSVSINPSWFLLKRKDGSSIDTAFYKIDFSKALLTFKKPVATDSVEIAYLRYPDFLTRKYFLLDDKIIVNNTNDLQRLYKLNQSNLENAFTPFDGLSTSGSISRGVTIGNNQNSVLNSELDLQISGKLSDKVSLRASIQDANIPLQESGYSQRLDEFDQVFIELFSDRWNIRAGDIDLVNNDSYFASFTKRVQGLLVNVNLGDEDAKTNIFASGALVRGQFTTSQFIAQEGNQGPYKLRGPNNELFVLIVSGSETVYVNGIALERGENDDYIIDYNAGEIIFNATYPITSEMRITVDYQYSERNYSRFIVFGGGSHTTEKFKLGVSVYSETDAKNQPLQQNLSSEQVGLLSEAGDDQALMVAPSAVEQAFSENRILYTKELINGAEALVFSNNPEDQLFSVKFSLVGDNQGDYILISNNAVENIYEYVAAIDGIPQGNYAPIVKLIAPEKLQVAVVNGRYAPSEKTELYFELVGSKNDINLFSSLDDADNDGFAGKIGVKQNIIQTDSLWNLNVYADADVIHENFKTVQRLYRAEFDRDWSLEDPLGNQMLLTSGAELVHPQKGIANYKFEHLNYSENFNGNRHNLLANLFLKRWSIYTHSSILNNSTSLSNTRFLRSYNRVTYSFNKQWVGTKIALEDNEQREKETDLLTNLSQRFHSYEAFTGYGDSTGVFVEVGYKYRVNDSLRANRVERVNKSNTYYLDSKLIQNQNTNLGIYVNYRTLKSDDPAFEDERSLNSRLNYNQQLFNNGISFNSIFETNSGSLAQQDFTYVEVEPGQGAYTWIDYNDNGIQELNEFELAQFADQGSFIRVLLPNQVFVKTHQNRFSQTLTLNPQQWSESENAWRKSLSHFYNQTSFLVDRKNKRDGNTFDLNPFSSNDDNQLALNKSIRNVLFYNRGKQRYTTSYTFLNNKTRNVLSIGFQQNNLRSHQLQFNHKFATSWLMNLKSSVEKNTSESENFSSRNYELEELRLQPKLSYIFNENARFDIFYQYTSKDNGIGEMEQLLQNNYGMSFTYNSTNQVALTGEVNFFKNEFTGNANTPVSYQILEGLQPGNNFTWSLLAQKKLTQFLDLNLNYFGRKTETSKTIHTGTVQLKAYF
ncbi:hypothetical protein ESY86_08425 [Subsaximicrobium wynnwilliamsii]|uniref:DUF2460 domain-containing protein n=1 Tax=Subsaximicrobium wynnwilliamsii TaxID=291179 RepID=A0A5C6ZHE0_9FLAO|nr:hypothetical protein [Subsaximicrobium wynnwilliamsii]TXD83713.1 hypothetical protein ESY87_08780 [Subsaximicrobium wynnwilliamsii]TXD89403.1 hypothetical protein ESY86_08425 [Subsaximicrobium wynnwilliamsii]TXE03550.1 hypothetical protein ESY88_07805 [Subsaximicrobium wynnwilliamsii]